MPYMPWMVISGYHNIKKISFENFDVLVVQGETGCVPAHSLMKRLLVETVISRLWHRF